MTSHHSHRSETGLYDGARVEKADALIAALGAVDELNSWLGLAAAQWRTVPREQDRLRWTQERLLEVGALLANPGGVARSASLPPGSLQTLDEWLREYRDALPPLRHFILPGGILVAATLHVARSVCRRAECNIWGVAATPDPGEPPAFLNRLSDVLFEMARWANAAAGVTDVEWRGSGQE